MSRIPVVAAASDCGAVLWIPSCRWGRETGLLLVLWQINVNGGDKDVRKNGVSGKFTLKVIDK